MRKKTETATENNTQEA